jgi:hypothetical protein
MKKKQYHKFPEALQGQLPLFYEYFEALEPLDEAAAGQRVRFHPSTHLHTREMAVRNFYKHISKIL